MKKKTDQKNPLLRLFYKYIVVSIAVCMLIISPILSKPAYAQGDNDVILTATTVFNFLSEKADNIAEEILVALAASAYKNGLKRFVTQLAADTAKWIASGDEGQKPLLYTSDWGSYLQSAGEIAAAGAIIDIAETVGVGDVCLGPSVAIDILLPQIEPPSILNPPQCSLEQLRQSWDVTSPQFLERFTLSFETGQNDLGIAVTFLNGIESEREREEERAEKEREEGGGFKAVTDKVGEAILTPGNLVREKATSAALSTENVAYIFTGDLIADTIDAFATTLAGQYLNQLRSGFFSLADVVDTSREARDLRNQARNSLLNSEAFGVPGNQAADLRFNDVFRPSITQPTNFNILAELAVCPTEVQFASLYNCVIDSRFLQAIQGSPEEGFLTVQEAIDLGLLNGDWAFGYTDPGAGIEPSFLNGYAYSNMKKLRQLRIIPVGWEFAAIRARQLSTRVTLQDVIDGFEDQGSPFFALVDPNWVLKAPVSRCTAKVASQISNTTGAGRLEECVDIQDCIAFGSNGECLSWGYCTHEKRSWDFPGETCSEIFATCDQFIEQGVEESTNNLWLSSTLDYEGCNADTAGCSWYSTVQNTADEWSESNRIYLTDKTEECDEDDAGCNEYIRMGNGTNLIRNGSFEDDGGNNYVLAGGDQTQDNGVPDGWSPRQASVELVEDNSIDGLFISRVSSQTGSNCQPGLQYVAPIGAFEVAQTYTLSGLVRTNNSTPRDLQASFQSLGFTISDVGDFWRPFAFVFVMPATPNQYTLVLGSNDGSCSDLNIGTDVFYDAIQLERGSTASAYKEYGSVNKISLQNAPACTFEEVGCNRYIAEDRNLGSDVTGIATGVDVCPQECSGYTTYEQQATPFEPARFENFIASTVNSCVAEAVGCEQFTNLDAVEQGGEGLEYYTEIRHCEKPRAECATFFTWEGSDQTGFQLRNFSLIADASGAPETVDGSTTCDPINEDCREFIAEDGSRFFRSINETITCSDSCSPLRARAGLVTEQECIDKRGTFDPTTNRCVFQAIAEESQQCQANFVGCREYVGNTGFNVAVVHTNDFEGGTLGGWVNGEISTESTEVGGASMKLGDQVGSIDELTATFIEDVQPGRSYILELSAKSSVSDFVTVEAFLGDDISEESRMGGFVTTTRNWNRYTVGPIVIPEDRAEAAFLLLQVTGVSDKPDEMSLFVDNLLLREIKDSVYAVKDSWDTPASCDTNPPLDGGTASRSMVGCQAYTIENDGANQRVFLKSFSRLCSEDRVGCEAVINTQNSDAPYREIYNEGDEAELVVPEDTVQYLVNRREFECNDSAIACQAIGEPTIDQDENVTSFETVYRINDPDRYGEILCGSNALFCKEFTINDGSTVYAKDPNQQQCEYREIPNSFPVQFAWFKIGDDEQNPEECINAQDNSFVSRCVADAISCTEYFEPITEEAFYYKKNSLLSRADTCNGVVDWKQGCVLFNDLSNRDLLFRSGDDVDFVGAPDACQTDDIDCNTNVLLKVNLNRQCSQWLTGVSTSQFWDKTTQQFRTNSYGLGRCLEADPLNPNICRTWDNAEDKPVLTLGEYANRETQWASDDLTGYSIPNLYPVETLRQRSIGIDPDGNPENFRLTKLSAPGASCQDTTDCALGQVCRLDLDPATGLFNGQCYVEEGINGEGQIAPNECRGYPEATSPFPDSLAIFYDISDEENPGAIRTKDQQFKNANIGQEGEDVECSYHKVRYGSQEDRYYGLDTIPPSSIKVDGDLTNFDRQDTFIGWEGYCLERDPSRPINGADDQFACLTWYPVDIIQGAFDINNSDLKAGYLAGEGAQYYCAEAILAEYRTTWQFCARATCGEGYTTTRRGSCAGHSHSRRECNPVGGDGWYPYDGQLVGNEELGIMCNKVARIADAQGRTSAWTTRILGDILPGSQEYFVEDLGWGYDQENEPYGSARPVATRLEDLAQPLIVLNPNDYVADCEECTLEEYPLSGYAVQEKSPRPFGICQDDTPSRNGKPCPYLPNAGAPFALFSDIDPLLINDQVVPIRRDNRLQEEESQPYPGSEDYTVGFRRLQQLFAKSYGVWEWQSLPSVCVGTCSGGISDGEFCASDSVCGQPEANVTYSCTSDICVGGFNNGMSCTENADCEFVPTGTIHQCVEDQGPAGAGNFICESGPFAGQACTGIDDCDETTANGVCGTGNNYCQATDADGNIVNGENSGKQCNTTSECASAGTCQVLRCSSDPEGTSSGLCAGKNAGEACGPTGLSATNRYVRIPTGNDASGWDFVASNPAIAQNPIVRPVVIDPNRPGGFNEGFTTSISVNGSTSGTIAAQDGRAPVTVSFYAYNENGEQMPLRLILIDWGDGSDPAESRGSFKNHKHLCRQFCSNAVGLACTIDEECQDDTNPDAQCLPFNFGDSPDACIDDGEGVNGFFSYSHTYTCEGPTPCSYTPTVLVRDSWGATTRVSYDGVITIEPQVTPTP